MAKEQTTKRKPVQLPMDLWELLWREARKRKVPTTPAQVAKEILTEHLKGGKK